MGFNIKKTVKRAVKDPIGTTKDFANDTIGATKDFANDMTDQLFGKEKTYDTLNQYQKDTMQKLGSAYSEDVAAGVNPDYNVSGNYFRNGIEKQALKGFDTVEQRQIDAGFANSATGTANVMATNRGLQGLQENLRNKAVGLDYNELISARDRLNSARQGLAGLANVSTQAKVQKPGLLSGAMQGIGMGASAASIAKGV